MARVDTAVLAVDDVPGFLPACCTARPRIGGGGFERRGKCRCDRLADEVTGRTHGGAQYGEADGTLDDPCPIVISTGLARSVGMGLHLGDIVRLGAAELPAPAKVAMRAAAKVMTRTAYFF